MPEFRVCVFRVFGDGKVNLMGKTRRLGDVAEATFLCRATEEGFRVARPFSDDSRYDAIVDNGRKRWLVQVKYTAQLCRPGVYVVRSGAAGAFGESARAEDSGVFGGRD